MTIKTLKTITTFLQKLGLSAEESDIYLALVGKGQQTADQLAKQTGLPKTNIYRRLEKLQEIGLTDKIVAEKKSLFQVTSPLLLGHLVSKKEEEAKTARDLLPYISEILGGLNTIGNPETKVLLFKGRDGIEQMIWNTLEAKEEIVGYTYRTLGDLIGPKSALKWNQEFNLRALKMRDIYGDEYLKSKTDKAKEEPGDWSATESRYLPPTTLNVIHQMDIYNDVVGIYNWYEGEVFGLEIHNAKVAKMQKQIFELLWGMAKKSQ